jgi:hypothetical protein
MVGMQEMKLNDGSSKWKPSLLEIQRSMNIFWQLDWGVSERRERERYRSFYESFYCTCTVQQEFVSINCSLLALAVFDLILPTQNSNFEEQEDIFVGR